MARWELWQTPEDSEEPAVTTMMIRASDERARADAIAEGLEMIWGTEAVGWNAAMQARNDFLGYGIHADAPLRRNPVSRGRAGLTRRAGVRRRAAGPGEGSYWDGRLGGHTAVVGERPPHHHHRIDA